ncbi:hypothetical protein [Nannocystis punicea]|uniref:Lipoprotein n=1 Tax=Nannocystis punicea TaxID=2995304 RepID=A0ABY7H6I8_9BACT|nr:hypothetical protein [Nannocystis poenicansa]WAS94700.1 hypothetical protein O0S08_00935 [Nannocystis poenicansa]
MQVTRTPALLRTVANALGALLLVPLLAACPKGDVGAPCNHGDVDPPADKVVTFPALSCNDLLCVYADEQEPPTAPCTTDEMCNAASEDGKARFACVEGECKLASTFVLERSMCSKTCGDDDDCKDGGIGQQVLAKETSCATGFSCVAIQTLGELCCQKLCVCNDDLSAGAVDETATECAKFPTDQSGKPICGNDMMMPTPTPTDTTGA